MKALFSLAIVGLVALVSCSEPIDFSPKEDQNQEGGSRLDRPQTIFEGEWLWIKTEGEGIAGPYTSDSTSTGYSIRFGFDWNTVTVSKKFLLSQGPLDLIETKEYSYTYVASDDSTTQVLTLEDSTGYAEKFLWRITTEENEGNTLVKMTLQNTEACCDNSFVQYFIRTKENIIESK